MNTRKIILASSSSRRKKLFEQIGLVFTVVPSNIEEKLNPRLKPRGQAEHLSKLKAAAVAKKHPDAIVIGADTFVVLGDEIIGKPTSVKDAKRMLKKLSRSKHSVITGFTIIDSATKKQITRSVETKVVLRKISGSEIDAYIATKEPLDKAGGYAIQERGALFVDRIEGDFFNVVGFPIVSIAQELKKFGVFVL